LGRPARAKSVTRGRSGETRPSHESATRPGHHHELKQASYRLRIDALRPLLARARVRARREDPARGVFSRRRAAASAREDSRPSSCSENSLDPADARLLRRHARKILLRHRRRRHVSTRTGSGGFAQWRTNRRFEATARILDHVVAGNEYLAAMFRQRGCERDGCRRASIRRITS
jgi:hypothetical protein